MTRSTIAGSVVAVVVAVVLGLSAETGLTLPGGVRRAVIPCGESPSSKTSVGSVLSVVSSEASVDSSFAYGGRTLYEGSTVCTSSTGQIKYRLTRDPPTYCNTGTATQASRATVYPSAGTAVVWARGSSWCAASEGAVSFGSAGTLKMNAIAPVFGVFIGKARDTTVKVVSGLLDVSRSGARGSVIVGPGQQVTAPFGDPPSRVVAIEVEGGERATISDLQFVVPSTKLLRPASGKSKALSRILDTGSIVVGYDSRLADPVTASFFKRYFAALAASWKLKLSLVPTTSGVALRRLKDRKLDLVATPLTPSSTFDVTPLLTDRRRKTWQLLAVRDDGYDNAIHRYVAGALTTGRYASAYRSAYGAKAIPSYEPFRKLIFGT
jgi:hypothetical protein